VAELDPLHDLRGRPPAQLVSLDPRGYGVDVETASGVWIADLGPELVAGGRQDDMEN
jgi:hypothetical protein